jgi:lysophospholipid acyltransferase (LPLAT)-like uncharacterized protein
MFGNPARFTRWQRVQLWLITWAGYLLIRLIGSTLRYSISWEDGSPGDRSVRPVIYSFWHSCMIPAIYLWRNRDARVMSSDSFDGEYTGRIIIKLGYVKIRGSSSRGAVRALIGMKREVDAGWYVAFTLDGPRGPRHVVKPGPVVLSRLTGAPMAGFHVACDRPWVLNTWDRLMIPRPFSRALMRVSRQIWVPKDADEEGTNRYLQELQSALDRAREFAEAHVSEVGNPEFPIERA